MDMQGVVVKDEPGVEYICAQRFVESKPGYVFKTGEQGLGFYLDRNCPAPGTKGGYAQSAAARVEASKTAPGTGSVPAAAGKPDIKQEKSSLTVEVPGNSLPPVPVTSSVVLHAAAVFRLTNAGASRNCRVRMRKPIHPAPDGCYTHTVWLSHTNGFAYISDGSWELGSAENAHQKARQKAAAAGRKGT